MNQKVLMISAGTKGIGRAVVDRAIRDGYQVSLSGRDEEALRRIKDLYEGKIEVARVDVSEKKDLEIWVKNTISSFGRIDAVVTNTGGPNAGRVRDVTDQMWHEGLESTLLLSTRMFQLTNDELKKTKGSLIHITSLVANRPNDVLAISSTLRLGMKALTELQALDLAPFGARVNAILPGHTWTDRQKHLVEIRAKESGRSFEDQRRYQEALIPMQRFAEPNEIAAVVSFLASKDSSYITGQSLVVDGGANSGGG